MKSLKILLITISMLGFCHTAFSEDPVDCKANPDDFRCQGDQSGIVEADPSKDCWSQSFDACIKETGCEDPSIDTDECVVLRGQCGSQANNQCPEDGL